MTTNANSESHFQVVFMLRKIFTYEVTESMVYPSDAFYTNEYYWRH